MEKGGNRNRGTRGKKEKENALRFPFERPRQGGRGPGAWRSAAGLRSKPRNPPPPPGIKPPNGWFYFWRKVGIETAGRGARRKKKKPLVLLLDGSCVTRQGLPAFFHPVTWERGDRSEEYHTGKNYSFFIRLRAALELSFTEEPQRLKQGISTTS